MKTNITHYVFEIYISSEKNLTMQNYKNYLCNIVGLHEYFSSIFVMDIKLCVISYTVPPLKCKYNADIDILQIDLVYISPLHVTTSHQGSDFVSRGTSTSGLVLTVELSVTRRELSVYRNDTDAGCNTRVSTRDTLSYYLHRRAVRAYCTN